MPSLIFSDEPARVLTVDGKDVPWARIFAALKRSCISASAVILTFPPGEDRLEALRNFLTALISLASGYSIVSLETFGVSADNVLLDLNLMAACLDFFSEGNIRNLALISVAKTLVYNISDEAHCRALRNQGFSIISTM